MQSVNNYAGCPVRDGWGSLKEGEGDMSKITVTTQAEWDAVDKDFEGYIYIKSSPDSCLIVAERKGWGVVARENSSVEAWENSSVEARENSSVVAWGNSSVVAWGNSSVVTRENSSVEAWGNSSVVAWGNSSVVARGNSSVVARENSSVEARENAQIAKYSDIAKLTTSGNARIVNGYPQTIEEYLDLHGIAHKDGVATLYKAVRNDLCSFHVHPGVWYEVGKTIQQKCDPDVSRDCSFGLHVSHLQLALDFGRGNSDKFKIIEVAVPIANIVLPHRCDGKVRTSELTVLREVPLEECGLYGKMLAKRREKEKATAG